MTWPIGDDGRPLSFFRNGRPPRLTRAELRDYARRAVERYDEYLRLERRAATLRGLQFGDANADQELCAAWEADELVASSTLTAVRLNLGALGVHPQAPVSDVVAQLRTLLAALDE